MAKKEKVTAPVKETKVVEGYTAAHMAEALDIEPRILRGHLRAIGAEKPEAGWVWKNKTAAKDVEKTIAQRIKDLATKPTVKTEPAEKPKSGKAKKSEVVDEAPKTKGKKAKVEAEPEAPAPKGKAKKKSAKE